MIGRSNAITGGAIGEYSKYQIINNVRASNTYFTFSHSLGVVPTLVLITCASGSPARTNNGYIYDGIFGGIVGAATGINLSSGVLSFFASKFDENLTDVGGGASNGSHNFRSASCTIMPYGKNLVWNTNTDYTIQLYA